MSDPTTPRKPDGDVDLDQVLAELNAYLEMDTGPGFVRKAGQAEQTSLLPPAEYTSPVIVDPSLALEERETAEGVGSTSKKLKSRESEVKEKKSTRSPSKDVAKSAADPLSKSTTATPPTSLGGVLSAAAPQPPAAAAAAPAAVTAPPTPSQPPATSLRPPAAVTARPTPPTPPQPPVTSLRPPVVLTRPQPGALSQPIKDDETVRYTAPVGTLPAAAPSVLTQPSSSVGSSSLPMLDTATPQGSMYNPQSSLSQSLDLTLPQASAAAARPSPGTAVDSVKRASDLLLSQFAAGQPRPSAPPSASASGSGGVGPPFKAATRTVSVVSSSGVSAGLAKMADANPPPPAASAAPPPVPAASAPTISTVDPDDIRSLQFELERKQAADAAELERKRTVAVELERVRLESEEKVAKAVEETKRAQREAAEAAADIDRLLTISAERLVKARAEGKAEGRAEASAGKTVTVEDAGPSSDSASVDSEKTEVIDRGGPVVSADVKHSEVGGVTPGGPAGSGTAPMSDAPSTALVVAGSAPEEKTVALLPPPPPPPPPAAGLALVSAASDVKSGPLVLAQMSDKPESELDLFRAGTNRRANETEAQYTSRIRAGVEKLFSVYDEKVKQNRTLEFEKSQFEKRWIESKTEVMNLTTALANTTATLNAVRLMKGLRSRSAAGMEDESVPVSNRDEKHGVGAGRGGRGGSSGRGAGGRGAGRGGAGGGGGGGGEPSDSDVEPSDADVEQPDNPCKIQESLITEFMNVMRAYSEAFATQAALAEELGIALNSQFKSQDDVPPTLERIFSLIGFVIGQHKAVASSISAIAVQSATGRTRPEASGAALKALREGVIVLHNDVNAVETSLVLSTKSRIAVTQLSRLNTVFARLKALEEKRRVETLGYKIRLSDMKKALVDQKKSYDSALADYKSKVKSDTVPLVIRLRNQLTEAQKSLSEALEKRRDEKKSEGKSEKEDQKEADVVVAQWRALMNEWRVYANRMIGYLTVAKQSIDALKADNVGLNARVEVLTKSSEIKAGAASPMIQNEPYVDPLDDIADNIRRLNDILQKVDPIGGEPSGNTNSLLRSLSDKQDSKYLKEVRGLQLQLKESKDKLTRTINDCKDPASAKKRVSELETKLAIARAYIHRLALMISTSLRLAKPLDRGVIPSGIRAGPLFGDVDRKRSAAELTYDQALRSDADAPMQQAITGDGSGGASFFFSLISSLPNEKIFTAFNQIMLALRDETAYKTETAVYQDQWKTISDFIGDSEKEVKRYEEKFNKELTTGLRTIHLLSAELQRIGAVRLTDGVFLDFIRLAEEKMKLVSPDSRFEPLKDSELETIRILKTRNDRCAAESKRLEDAAKEYKSEAKKSADELKAGTKKVADELKTRANLLTDLQKFKESVYTAFEKAGEPLTDISTQLAAANIKRVIGAKGKVSERKVAVPRPVKLSSSEKEQNMGGTLFYEHANLTPFDALYRFFYVVAGNTGRDDITHFIREVALTAAQRGVKLSPAAQPPPTLQETLDAYDRAVAAAAGGSDSKTVPPSAPAPAPSDTVNYATIIQADEVAKKQQGEFDGSIESFDTQLVSYLTPKAYSALLEATKLVRSMEQFAGVTIARLMASDAVFLHYAVITAMTHLQCGLGMGSRDSTKPEFKLSQWKQKRDMAQKHLKENVLRADTQGTVDTEWNAELWYDKTSL